jgi:CHAT domain-containing protein
MNEFALFHMRLGYYEQAVTLFQQALKLRDEIAQKSPGNKENQISKHYLLANLGLAYEHQGFYTLALGEYEKSRAIATTLKLDPELISGDIGSTYKKQGNFALALRYFSESLAARERAGSRPQIISALINLGEIHQMTGDGEKSIELYKRALELSERETNKRLICSSHRSLGTGFFNQKMYDQALIEFEKTLAICDPGFNREETADVTVQIAAVYALRRDLARATALADNAYEIVSRIESPGLRSQVLATVGRIYLMANQIEKAKKALLESISATEQMRGNVAGNEAQRQAFFENKTAPYLTFVELLLAQNQPAEALTYVEAAKARVLLDVTQSGKVSLSKALSSAEQEEEKYLNNELVSLNIQIYREQLRPQPDQAKQAELMKQREKVRLRYEDFRTKLYVVHPELKVRRGEAKTLTLDEAKELLPDNQTALLNYVVTPARAQVFVLTKAKDGGAKLRVYPLAINRETLTTQVEQFRGQLAGRDARFGKLARDLYSLLLKKAQAELPPQTKLIIVPDGPLWELPFQALLTTQGRFLWEDHIIAYAPSLTVLREMTKAARDKGNKRGTQSLFAIGDPALGREAIERAKSLMGGETLSQLPEARTQVETLRKFYDANRSKVFTGEAAAEATVKSQAGKFDILHFATHSVLNDRNPLYSYILLAQTDAAQASAPSKESPKEDGLLEAWEIMQMDLHADLAVLSACETARGRVGAGEGMIGLTWALFVAGVPTTVVSQWKVSADSTADLMVEFHRQLQLRNAGSLPRPASEWTKAEALRLAALKLLRGGQSRHPFYWAGFVLIGQPR